MNVNTWTNSEIEVVTADYSEGDEFEFVADVRTRLHNPSGDDVVVLRTFKARPKFDDLVHAEDHVHEHTEYWWPDSYPDQGDTAFADSMEHWAPEAELTDSDALLRECVGLAKHDPVAELDMLLSRGEGIRERLEQDSDD